VLSQNGTSNTTLGGSSNVWGYDSQSIINRVCVPELAALSFFDGNTSNQTSLLLSGVLTGGYLTNFISDIRNVQGRVDLELASAFGGVPPGDHYRFRIYVFAAMHSWMRGLELDTRDAGVSYRAWVRAVLFRRAVRKW